MLCFTKPTGTKKEVKLLKHMVKGFIKDYASAGDNLGCDNHVKAAKDLFTNREDNLIFWYEHNALVGYTVLRGLAQFVNIDIIYILPEHRGKGLSTAIYKTIMNGIEDQHSITLSMKRIKNNIEYFRSLGFTNFIGSGGQDSDKSQFQYNDRGLAHITTEGVFDLCLENIDTWNELICEMNARKLDAQWFKKKLFEKMIINDTTSEQLFSSLKEAA